MKVSVIVPVYNVAAYLDRCIRSVLELKTPLELILIDDGSTDGSGKLCDAWAAKDERIVLIRQENRGLSETRNQGIRESRGEYILFLDGDDFLDPEQTDRLLEALDGSQSIGLGLYREYYPRERYVPEKCGAFLAMRGDTPMGEFLEKLPHDGSSCYMIAPRFVVKREFLLRNDLFFRGGIYHEDEEWTQRLLCRGERVFVTHFYFYCYRQGRMGAITSGVTEKHIFDSLSILALTDETRQGQPPEKARYLRRRMGMLYLNALVHTPGLPEKKQEEAFLLLQNYASSCLPVLSGPLGMSAKLLAGALGVRRASRVLWRARQIKRKWQGGQDHVFVK